MQEFSLYWFQCLSMLLIAEGFIICFYFILWNCENLDFALSWCRVIFLSVWLKLMCDLWFITFLNARENVLNLIFTHTFKKNKLNKTSFYLLTHPTIKSELKPVKSHSIYSTHSCTHSSLSLCVSAQARGNHWVWHCQGAASATISQQVYLREREKKTDPERFAVHDLRAAVARATLIQKPPETDESEGLQLSVEHCVADRKMLCSYWRGFRPWRPSQQRKILSRISFKTPQRES